MSCAILTYLSVVGFFLHIGVAFGGVKTAELLCPVGWSTYGNKCYLFDSNKVSASFYTCQDYCTSKDSNALCIENAQKEEYVLSFMPGNSSVWLHYNDIASEGNFVWDISCSNGGYSNWRTSTLEPNGGTSENCVELSTTDSYGEGWNDVPCISTIVGVDAKYCFCEAPLREQSGVTVETDSDADSSTFDLQGSGGVYLSVAVLGGIAMVAAGLRYFGKLVHTILVQKYFR